MCVFVIVLYGMKDFFVVAKNALYMYGGMVSSCSELLIHMLAFG